MDDEVEARAARKLNYEKYELIMAGLVLPNKLSIPCPYPAAVSFTTILPGVTHPIVTHIPFKITNFLKVLQKQILDIFLFSCTKKVIEQ